MTCAVYYIAAFVVGTAGLAPADATAAAAAASRARASAPLLCRHHSGRTVYVLVSFVLLIFNLFLLTTSSILFCSADKTILLFYRLRSLSHWYTATATAVAASAAAVVTVWILALALGLIK